MMEREIRHFHLFCGLGGGALGFNQGEARVGNVSAAFRCIGGIDVDPASVRDFEQLAGVPGTVLDLFDRDQYGAWHGVEPPADWRESTPQDIQRAAGGERPHIVFMSPPCKGFSGLLAESNSKTDKYQALNRLTLRGLMLVMEAWRDDPPELLVFENVPRIQKRGGAFLERIESMLDAYGYACARSTHDCGEIGGLAQRRRRFLLVARHREKVPPFLHEPIKRPLRAVGDVLSHLPLPGDARAGPMHQLPKLQWKTWLRLAFVEAGGDWRSLERLRVVDGYLQDFQLVPAECFRGTYGVTEWNATACTVTGRAGPTTGRFAIADPRYAGKGDYRQYGVLSLDQTSGAITGKAAAGTGSYSIADPRLTCGTDPQRRRFNNVYRVVPWEGSTQAVTGGSGPTAGGQAVADRRVKRADKQFRVVPWGDAINTISGQTLPNNGASSVADPRLPPSASRFDNNFKVADWLGQANRVTSATRPNGGACSVADPRVLALPEANAQLDAVIISDDDTWHRPFSTLELAALQGLVDTDDPCLLLDGHATAAWRERIGNAVPAPAAAAIASVMGRTLLMAWTGETFSLEMTPVWVRPIAVGLSVQETASA